MEAEWYQTGPAMVLAFALPFFGWGACWLWSRFQLKRAGIDAQNPGCPECLYLICGWSSPNCPECGTDIRATGVQVRPSVSRRAAMLCFAGLILPALILISVDKIAPLGDVFRWSFTVQLSFRRDPNVVFATVEKRAVSTRTSKSRWCATLRIGDDYVKELNHQGYPRDWPREEFADIIERAFPSRSRDAYLDAADALEQECILADVVSLEAGWPDPWYTISKTAGSFRSSTEQRPWARILAWITPPILIALGLVILRLTYRPRGTRPVVEGESALVPPPS